ncbi:MAG: DUF6048 family protein [Marinoscillum sp.]
MKNIAILVLVGLGFSAFGQRPGQQLGNQVASKARATTMQDERNEPKEPRDFRPSMVKLSYDFIPLGATLFSENRSGQAFQASMDFDQYFFAVEYGTQKTNRGETFDYHNQGWYWTMGPEVNFLKSNTKGHSLTFGLRYGQSRFSDWIYFVPNDNFFGNYPVFEANDELRARWMEMTVGLNAKVWKNLYMGYTVRYKIFRTVKGIDGFAPYDVPGFGPYEDNTGVQFNYYVGWAFQWREKFPAPEVTPK